MGRGAYAGDRERDSEGRISAGREPRLHGDSIWRGEEKMKKGKRTLWEIAESNSQQLTTVVIGYASTRPADFKVAVRSGNN